MADTTHRALHSVRFMESIATGQIDMYVAEKKIAAIPQIMPVVKDIQIRRESQRYVDTPVRLIFSEPIPEGCWIQVWRESKRKHNRGINKETGEMRLTTLNRAYRPISLAEPWGTMRTAHIPINHGATWADFLTPYELYYTGAKRVRSGNGEKLSCVDKINYRLGVSFYANGVYKQGIPSDQILEVSIRRYVGGLHSVVAAFII